jgi:hypothetical protein
MATTAEKLGIKAGTTTLVLGVSVADAHALLGELPADAGLSGTAESADLVLFFAESVDEVRRGVTDAFARMRESGRCWVAYRKGASRSVATTSGEPALHRDTLQAALAEVGLDGVTLIAIDDTWSAMRIKLV